MIRKYNNNTLNIKKLDHEGCIYFVQKWTELTFIKTIDNYQYSIHNTYTIAEEVLRLAHLSLDGTYPTLDNLQDCLNEFKRLLKEDIVIKKYNSGLYGSLQFLANQKISAKTDNIKVANIKRLISALDYQLNILKGSYLDWITSELVSAVENFEYGDIDYYSNALVSQCIFEGWSERALFDLHRVMLKDDSDDIELLKKALSRLQGPTSEFEVYIRINDQLDIEELTRLANGFNIEILSYEQAKARCTEPLKRHLNIQAERYYFSVKAIAKDYVSAALHANESCKKMMELLTFYNQTNPWSADGIDIYVRCGTYYVSRTTTAQIYGTNLYIESSNSIFEKTIEIFTEDDPLMENMQAKLQSVYSYMNISKMASYQEEKFLNMWIGLESFMNTGNYSNIISHVKNVLPAVMCQRYLYKLIRNLCEDMIRCEVSITIDGVQVNLDRANKTELVSEMITYLKDETQCGEIISQVEVNSLLRERVKNLSNLFKDENKLHEKITKYHETIYWHVQRLYRLRNDITHSGYLSNSDITPYIEHLHNFIASMIMEVIYVVSNEGYSSKNVGSVLAYLVDSYEAFYQKYSSRNSVYDTGIIKLE